MQRLVNLDELVALILNIGVFLCPFCVWQEFGWYYSLVRGTIHQAVFDNDLPLIEAILTQQKEAINELDQEGYTPLHVAVIKNHHILIPLLVERGADYKLQDAVGRTAIMIAASSGFAESLTALLSISGVEFTAWHPMSKREGRDHRKKSALWLAALGQQGDYQQCLTLLCKHAKDKAHDILDDRDEKVTHCKHWIDVLCS